jgi:cytidylate kinase
MPEPRFDGVITIDGPAGVGKTTLGHWLSDELGIPYLETGFVYRALTYGVIQRRLEPDAWDQRLVEGLDVHPRLPPPPRPRPQFVSIHGTGLDVDSDLFSAEVDALVARVSSVPSVRAGVRVLCRRLVGAGPMIISGRDTATSIVPMAACKIFLTAERSVRSARVTHGASAPPEGRPGAEYEVAGHPGPAEVRHELESRLLGNHLRPAPDAHIIDTTSLTVAAVRERAMRCLQ